MPNDSILTPAPFVVTSLLVSVSALTACTALPRAEGRLYVGAGALVSELDPDTDEAAVEIGEGRSAGGSVTLGYDVGNRLSVEGHASSLGEVTFDPAGSLSYTVGGLSALYYALNDEDARGRREGFSVFGRLGVGFMDNSADEVEFERVNDVHLVGGLGLEYGFGSGLALRAEALAHDADARFGQLGVLYRFGEPARSGARPPPRRPQALPDPRPSPAPSVVEPLPPILDAGPPVVEPSRPAAGPSIVETRPVPAPVRDADGDTVPDADDACPDTARSRPVDERGCSLLDGVLVGVEFAPGSDRLDARAEAALAEMADVLREYPRIDVAIDVHTSNRGSAAGNLDLSRRRALAIARYLAFEGGVEPARLKPRAYGESRPLTSNATEQGRATNERVELRALE